MTNVDVVCSKAFRALFSKHCLCDGASMLSNDHVAKSAHYFRDNSKSSNAFNRYLEEAYAFYRSDAGLLAVNDDICFLIDTENTLVILGSNPRMMVHELANDELHYGFSDVVELQLFDNQYISMFGNAPSEAGAGVYSALYQKLPVWCPGLDTAFRDDE
jgi:hypothetical protein